MNSYSIFLSRSDLFHLAQYPLSPSCCQKWQDFILFFNGWVIFHIYSSRLLYPFIYWWTFRLLPYLGYCKECCSEHRVNKSFLIGVLFTLDKYPGVELQDRMVVLFLIFQGISILFSVVAGPIYIPTNSAQKFPFLHILANTCYLLSFW